MRRVAPVLFSALLALASCSGGEEPAAFKRDTAVRPSTTIASPPRFIEADVRLVQALLSYRRQAIQLCEMAQIQAGNQQVKQVAAVLPDLYRQEEAKLSALLAGWGRAVPAKDAPAEGLPGTVNNTDLTGMRRLSGPAFDRRFLDLLIANQQGVVKLAAVPPATGGSGLVRQTASDAVSAGTAFIASLSAIRTSLNRR